MNSSSEQTSPVSDFMEENFRHFNAREVLEAAQSFKQLTSSGGKMFLALALMGFGTKLVSLGDRLDLLGRHVSLERFEQAPQSAVTSRRRAR